MRFIKETTIGLSSAIKLPGEVSRDRSAGIIHERPTKFQHRYMTGRSCNVPLIASTVRAIRSIISLDCLIERDSARRSSPELEQSRRGPVEKRFSIKLSERAPDFFARPSRSQPSPIPPLLDSTSPPRSGRERELGALPIFTSFAPEPSIGPVLLAAIGGESGRRNSR